MATETPVPPTPPVELSPADEQKKLGNEAFIAKRYDVAMKHYTAAIEIDPENAVYYSNRSACYAGKQLWKESMVDSEVALLKDPSFMKAYYRLSVAQMELAMYEDAIQSLQRGLVKEPENALLIKQVRIVKAKQAQARTAAMGQRQLTDAQKKEIMDLQEQTKIYTKDLRGVQYKITGLQREVRMGAATKQQIDALPTDVPLYRACGKAFLAVPNCDFVQKKLADEQAENAKEIKDLLDRQEYLERRVNANNANFKELTQGL